MKRQSLFSLLLILLVTLTFSGSGQALGASLRSNTSAPSPNAVITLTGSGFGASEVVDIYFDIQDAVLAVTSAAGGFTAKMTVPGSAVPGEHWATAVGRKSGRAAQRKLEVTINWFQFMNGPRHTGVSVLENQLDGDSVQSLDIAWSSKTDAAYLYSSPAVVGTSVYVAGTDGAVYAYDRKSGNRLWKRANLNASPRSSPAVASTKFGGYSGRVVLIGTSSGLRALNAADKTVVWTKTTADAVSYSPTVASGRVYFAAGARVYCLNLTGATQIWNRALTAEVSGSPAVAHGMVFVNCADSKVRALRASNGAPVWDSGTAIASVSRSSPTVANGMVFIGSADNKLYALNAYTGVKRWDSAAHISGSIHGTPAVCNGRVYIGSGDGYVYAFELSTGALAHKSAAQYSFMNSSPVVANGMIFIGTWGNHFLALDESLNELWASGTANDVDFSSAAIAGGWVYVAGYDGRLYAFNTNPAPLYSPAEDTRPDPTALIPDCSLQLPE